MSDTDLENMIARKLTEAAAIGGVFHPNSSLVTEVIQAIKGAGYIRIQPTLDELQQKTLEEYPNKLMTGQEFYERFEKELDGKVFYYLKSDDEVSTTLSICLSAAKRAAGIDT